MRRRDLVVSVAALAALPALGAAAQAQQPERIRRVGLLLPLPESDPVASRAVKVFIDALAHFGWAEGKKLQTVARFTSGDSIRLKSAAVQLVEMSPDAILAVSPAPVAALQRLTHTVPIVFILVTDPVGQGFVQSLARPGGNITGFSVVDPPVMGKWLQLLKEIAPNTVRVAVIFNPDMAPHAPLLNRAIEADAPSLGMTVTLAPVYDDRGIEDAVAKLGHDPGVALVAMPEAFAVGHRGTIIAAASRHALPLIGLDFFARDGGLISYWSDVLEAYAAGASYIDRILRGASPADLPVQQPTKYSLIINLKTAKALGLTVPQSLLQRADEVIE